MIKDKNTTVGYHCPFCGMSILNEINIFSMNGNLIKMKCVCGGSELIATITKDRKIRLTMPCIVCPNSHSFTISSGIFFERELFSFSCTFTAINICFIGKNQKVYEALKKNEEELLDAFAMYESGYDTDKPDNGGFTTSFSKDTDENKDKDKKPGVNIFNPFEIFDELDGFDDDFDDLDEFDEFGEFDGDLFEFWDGGNINNTDRKKSKAKATGFELYKTNNNNKTHKTTKNDKVMEIDQNVDLSKLKIKSYPVILQILDIVSRLYRDDKIFCECGEFDGKIILLENFVLIACKNCNSERKIKSSAVSDIEYIAEMGELHLDFDDK